MNKKIVKQVFPEMVERIEQNKCPICNKSVVKENFRDILSLKEFQISGMCQKCQDDFFGKQEDVSTEKINYKNEDPPF
jgi:ribosomal protein L37AE/L43A